MRAWLKSFFGKTGPVITVHSFDDQYAGIDCTGHTLGEALDTFCKTHHMDYGPMTMEELEGDILTDEELQRPAKYLKFVFDSRLGWLAKGHSAGFSDFVSYIFVHIRRDDKTIAPGIDFSYPLMGGDEVYLYSSTSTHDSDGVTHITFHG